MAKLSREGESRAIISLEVFREWCCFDYALPGCCIFGGERNVLLPGAVNLLLLHTS
jgi:hypothetical protein